MPSVFFCGAFRSNAGRIQSLWVLLRNMLREFVPAIVSGKKVTALPRVILVWALFPTIKCLVVGRACNGERQQC